MNDYIIAKNASQAAAAAAKAVKASKKVYFAAGTTDLYVQLKDGILTEPNVFIDISGANDLKKISAHGPSITIGAAASFSEIMKSAVCRKELPLLVDAAKTVGSPLIRNRATIGGNIANSSPAGDSLPALAALDASLVLRSGAKKRKVAFLDFFTGPKRNVLSRGEFIESVIIPKNKFNFSSFLKLGSRKALAISKVSLAVAATVKNDVIQKISIAAGAVGPTVIICRNAEKLLAGAAIGNDKSVAAAKAAVAADISPIDDFRSTSVYRRQTAAALLEKALLNIPSGR